MTAVRLREDIVHFPDEPIDAEIEGELRKRFPAPHLPSRRSSSTPNAS